MGKQTSNNHRSGGYFSINGALLLLLLVAVVLLSIVILVRFAPTSPVWCVPSRTLPDMDEEVSFRENIASSDNTALANMVGYIHYRNDTYLPLVLTKFDVDDDQLAFTSECATVTWKYGAQNGSSSVPEINLNSLSIGVPIRGAGSNQTRISHLCEIPEVFGTYYAHQRFSCLKRVSLSCLGEKDANGAREPVAELVLESFEIQLFVNATGNERKMKKHQFSIAQLEESCDIIQGVYYHRFHKDNKPDHKALDTD